MNAPTLPVIVAEIPKNQAEAFRVTLNSFKGSTVIDIRTFFRNGDELKPTRSGLSTSVRHLPALAAAMTEALARARSMGLVEE